MFLRPSPAHYTYRPPVSPVRDRRAYKLPTSLYNNIEPDFDLGLTRDFTDDDLVFRAPGHPNNLSAESRYRRALEEAYAAKEELRAQTEETRLRDEAIALRSEIARLRAERARKEARLNQIRLEEARLAQAMCEEARMIQAAKQRERRAAEEARQEVLRRELAARRRAALHQQERARAAVLQLFEAPAAHQVARPQARPITLADLLERSLAQQEIPKHSQPVKTPTPTPAPKVQPKTVESPEQVNMKEVYDFIFNFFCPQGVPQQQPSTSATPASAAAPQLLEKGKGKAAPELATTQASAHDILKQHLEERLARETEQEMAETVRANLNSMRDQHAEPSATSSKVKIENAPATASTSSADLKRVPELADNAAQNVKTQFAAHRRSTSEPATPLEHIQSIRTTLTSLRTSFHFPATPDYNNTTGTLTYSAANTPLRAYEHALNHLLEQLDGIESEGDETVRGRRREVVKEVERALEEFDERVRAASPVRESPTPRPEEAEIEVKEEEKVETEVAEGQQGKVEVPVEADAQEIYILPAETPIETSTLPASDSVDSPVTQPTDTIDDAHSSSVEPTIDEEASINVLDAYPAPTEDPAAVESVLEAPTPVEEPVAVEEPESIVKPELTTPNSIEDVPEQSQVDATPVETLPADTSLALEADATPRALDAPASVPDASARSDETAPASNPQPDQSSESFLTSLSHNPFRVPLAPRHEDANADELEDSVRILIEKEEDRDSEHSWSEVEPESA